MVKKIKTTQTEIDSLLAKNVELENNYKNTNHVRCKCPFPFILVSFFE